MNADYVYFGKKNHRMMGQYITHHRLCNTKTADCTSRHAANRLLMRMMDFIDLEANTNGLTYTLACDSLRFMLEKRDTPMHGAVAVPKAQAVAWLEALRRSNETTTFEIVEADDGSLAHIKYSRLSNIRLVALILLQH